MINLDEELEYIIKGLQQVKNMLIISGFDQQIIDSKVSELYQKLSIVNSYNLEKCLPATVHRQFPTPSEIKGELDKQVYGQELAKKVIAVGTYLHYKRLDILDTEKKFDRSASMRKSNIILVGSSGTGKTLIVRTLANILNVPFLHVDITKYSATGYVGKDLSSIPRELYKLAGTMKEAERGIIYVDEIDKTARGDNGDQINQIDVQNGLLKIVEGCEYDVGGKDEMKLLDTSKVLFIFSGAFPGIDKIIEKRKSKGGIGFNSDISPIEKGELLPKDLIEYGLLAELVGRISSIGHLNDLKKQDLVKIMMDLDSSDANEYSKIFRSLGLDVEFTDDGCDYIADKALESGTGARALKGLIDRLFLALKYVAPDRDCSGVKVKVDKKFCEVMLEKNNERD